MKRAAPHNYFSNADLDSAVATPGCPMCAARYKSHSSRECPHRGDRMEIVDFARGVAFAVTVGTAPTAVSKVDEFLAKCGTDETAQLYVQRQRHGREARLDPIDRSTQKTASLLGGDVLFVVAPCSAAARCVGAVGVDAFVDPTPKGAFDRLGTPISGAASSFPIPFPPPEGLAGRNWASFPATPSASLPAADSCTVTPVSATHAQPAARAQAPDAGCTAERTVRVVVKPTARPSLVPPMTRGALRAALNCFGIVLRVRVPAEQRWQTAVFVEFSTKEAALAMISTGLFPFAFGRTAGETVAMVAQASDKPIVAARAPHDGLSRTNGLLAASQFGLATDCDIRIDGRGRHHSGAHPYNAHRSLLHAVSQVIRSTTSDAAAWLSGPLDRAPFPVLAGLKQVAALAAAAVLAGGPLPSCGLLVCDPAAALTCVLRQRDAVLAIAIRACTDHASAQQLLYAAFDNAATSAAVCVLNQNVGLLGRIVGQLRSALAVVGADTANHTTTAGRTENVLEAALRCHLNFAQHSAQSPATTARMLVIALAIGAACELADRDQAAAVRQAVGEVLCRAPSLRSSVHIPDLATAGLQSESFDRPDVSLVVHLLLRGSDAIPCVFGEPDLAHAMDHTLGDTDCEPVAVG